MIPLLFLLIFFAGVLGSDLSYGLVFDLSPGYPGWKLVGEAHISGRIPVPVDTVFLRFLRGKETGVHVNSVGDGHSGLAWDLSDPTTLAVELPRRSQSFSVAVSYEMEVPPFPGGGYGILAVGERTVTVSQAYPLVAPWRGGWVLEPVFPWGDALVAEAGDYRARISPVPGWDIVGTGVEVPAAGGVEITGDELREFAFVLLQGYRSEAVEVGGAEVRSWFRPEEERAGKRALELSADALGILSELFGEYPFPELDVVEVPLRGAAGVEFPGLILAGVDYYRRFESGRRELIFPMIFAHEVAHQWWYAQVGNDQVLEPWLDEALATYSSGLVLERWGLFDELLDYWEYTYELARERNPGASVFDPLWDFPDGTGYGGIVYSGGALFFLELERAMGRERLISALRRYQEEFRWGIAKGEDLLSILREEGGEAAEEVIRRWFPSRPPEAVRTRPGS